ncbi:MAG: molybdenum cofactor guanylyltransferase MobA [Rubrivivax sp.]
MTEPLASPPASATVTGLVLAGGRGSRMGGVDKGLQLLDGRPLVAHALERLRPQVAALAINANRNTEAYAAFGVPVWPDALADYPGPLAGMLAGLAGIEGTGSEWLVTVPCDTPRFPVDLVARLLVAARAAGVRAAMPVTANAEVTGGDAGAPLPQPVFCLLHRSLRPALEAALAAGERKIERFTRAQGQVLVPFDDAQAFFNANTPEELERLREGAGGGG